MAMLVLTVIGDDRLGLVSALSGAVADAGGNWIEGELSRLAGKFAGIVLVDVPLDAEATFRAAVATLGADGVLDVTITPVVDDPDPTGEALHVEITGQDRPGIVRQISSALTQIGVSIESISSLTYEAPMGSGEMFGVDAMLILPEIVTAEEVRAALEGIDSGLVVDVLDDE